MSNSSSRTIALLFILCGSELGAARIEPEVVERGKKATALVEVSGIQGETWGSAFCVEKSGLFITNAHVVTGADGKVGRIRLVVDCGLATQRILPAKVLRHDDEIDLALLQVNADSGLIPLELGQDAGLVELAEVTTFGFPFGRMPAVGRAEYPDITVLPSRITSLRRDQGRLAAVQFDNQLNPGNSGGPVLDGSGKVVAVARATVRGAALNVAIPVGRLAEFLIAPGLAFAPPPLAYDDRARPVTWTIRVQPSTPSSKLPEKLSVAVTVNDGASEPRRYTAQPAGAGVFTATIIPVPLDPERMVQLNVWDNAPRRFRFQVFVKDDDVTVGSKTFRLSDLSFLYGGPSPRVQTWRGDVVSGPIRGLTQGVKVLDRKSVAIDLEQAIDLHVLRTSNALKRVESIEAVVEVKQGTKVLATAREQTKLTVATANVARPSLTPASNVLHTLADEGLVKLGGVLNVAGAPRGAGKETRPPRIAIPPARLTPESTEAPLVRRLGGTISDIAVGGGGRFLILTIKGAQRLAVFDVNAADIVKTIPLPSANMLVAAGARKLLIAFPEEKLLQRWDLETLRREGGSRPSPIDSRMIRLVLGSDSDGPALAYWSTEKIGPGVVFPRISFIDLDSLTVLRVGLIASRGDHAYLSPSGGSFMVQHPDDRDHIRASAGGAFFATRARGIGTLSVHGRALIAAPCTREDFGHAVPGPDGRTLFTGTRGRLDLDGNPIGLAGQIPNGLPDVTIPSSDPAYCLRIGGLPDILTYGFANPKPRSSADVVTASIHAADGSRLLTVHGLDEMAPDVKAEVAGEWMRKGFTIDKRFYLVPAAHLLITIPPENDRLILRRLDLEEALDRAGGNDLIVVSTPLLAATAGQTLEHRIVARSKPGGITCALASGPDGLKLAPDGQLTWTVPRDLQGEDVAAVVKLKDASGQERSYMLEIRVK
jgi:hypothetical protein